jgi:hypothetical protein
VPSSQRTREYRAAACHECGLIEILAETPDRDAKLECSSCGGPCERTRTITREECAVCGKVAPHIEYDGKFVSSGGFCAHRAMGETVYAQMNVPVAPDA